MMCIRDGALSPSVFTGLKRRLDDLENAAKSFKPPSVVSFAFETSETLVHHRFKAK